MVEHNLAKVGVASSNLVSRSNEFIKKAAAVAAFLFHVFGCVAKWLCSGLQSHLQRFDSARSLHLKLKDFFIKHSKPASYPT